jgi:hypothetical protein
LIKETFAAHQSHVVVEKLKKQQKDFFKTKMIHVQKYHAAANSGRKIKKTTEKFLQNKSLIKKP